MLSTRAEQYLIPLSGLLRREVPVLLLPPGYVARVLLPLLPLPAGAFYRSARDWATRPRRSLL